MKKRHILFVIILLCAMIGFYYHRHTHVKVGGYGYVELIKFDKDVKKHMTNIDIAKVKNTKEAVYERFFTKEELSEDAILTYMLKQDHSKFNRFYEHSKKEYETSFKKHGIMTTSWDIPGDILGKTTLALMITVEKYKDGYLFSFIVVRI